MGLSNYECQIRKVKVYVNLIISKLSMKALDKLLQKGFLSSMSLAFIFLIFYLDLISSYTTI